MRATDENRVLSPSETYAIASRWGSYVRAGDPGQVFYTFRSGDARPENEAHRKECIAYAHRCHAEAIDRDKPALMDLIRFLRASPLRMQEDA